MSNEYDDLNDDENDDEQERPQNAAKVLRQQNKKLADELAEMRKEREDLAKRVRQRDIADALEEHGAPKRIARYVDVEEASSDGVLNWLNENGADFGWEPPEQPDENEAHNREQAQRLSRASAQAPEGKVVNAAELIASAKTREELQAAYRLIGG